MKITRTPATPCLIGEGPVWDQREQALYYLDITGRKVHRFDPARETMQSWDTPKPVGSVALREGGGAVLALRDQIHALDFASGKLDLLASIDNPGDLRTVNDGKVDRQGRFLLGLCHAGMENPQPTGGLLSFGRDHRISVLDTGIHQSNGPCFSPDGRTLYFSDSFTHATFAYDYDPETGRAHNKRLFADTREYGLAPDGSTVDRDGLVWISMFRGGKIVAFRPDGKLERIVPMPLSMAVSVMFGGPDLDRLYVTTINPTAFGEAPEEGAGHVYVVEGLGARGLAEPRFAG